jgi:hypothetical protein
VEVVRPAFMVLIVLTNTDLHSLTGGHTVILDVACPLCGAALPGASPISGCGCGTTTASSRCNGDRIELARQLWAKRKPVDESAAAVY